MDSQDFKALEMCTMEIREQKKTIDELIKKNAELEQMINGIYGTYQIIQYTCEGQCNNLESEIERLRNYVLKLEEALKKKSG